MKIKCIISLIGVLFCLATSRTIARANPYNVEKSEDPVTNLFPNLDKESSPLTNAYLLIGETIQNVGDKTIIFNGKCIPYPAWEKNNESKTILNQLDKSLNEKDNQLNKINERIKALGKFYYQDYIAIQKLKILNRDKVLIETEMEIIWKQVDTLQTDVLDFYKRSVRTRTFAVYGVGDRVDGDTYSDIVWYAGTFSYVNVLGASVTVRAFATSPDLARQYMK
jgi:hypothetical protein